MELLQKLINKIEGMPDVIKTLPAAWSAWKLGQEIRNFLFSLDYARTDTEQAIEQLVRGLTGKTYKGI